MFDMFTKDAAYIFVSILDIWLFLRFVRLESPVFTRLAILPERLHEIRGGLCVAIRLI